MTTPHNKIDRTEFARMAAEGLTPAELAEHFRTRLDTVSRIRNELGMSTRRPKATIDRDELLRLHEQGYTTNELAAHFGCNPDSVSRVKKTLGISINHVLTPERLALAAQRIEDGWSFEEIHRTEGISRDSLQKYFPGKSWTPEQAAEYRALRRQETGRHFNQRPNTYRQEHRNRTHPVGATKQARSTTLEALPTHSRHTAAQDAQQGRGRVIGHAA